ncbi:hypothetical protein HRbin30_01205 [bacterium HR30]|nr:hypothetical protein HRbin30_01205 [bacterium HR30]
MRYLAPYWLQFAVGVCVAGMLSGCAGDGPPSVVSGGETFAALQSEIFARHCALGPCHSAGVAAGGLVLEGPNAYDELVNAAPENAAARAAGWLRVTPHAPEQSFLWIKLTGPGPGLGSRMPLGAAPLSEDTLARIEAWILSGAPRGEDPVAVPTPSATPTPTVTPSGRSTPTPSSFTRLRAEIFGPRCAVAFCHDGTSRAAGLDLTNPYQALVGAVPTNAHARESGWLLVAPGQPEASFLLTKLKLSSFDPRWGSPMPLSGPRLEPEWLEALTDWIARGAPDD